MGKTYKDLGDRESRETDWQRNREKARGVKAASRKAFFDDEERAEEKPLTNRKE